LHAFTQLVNGVGSIISTTQTGVAHFAHTGGRIAGAYWCGCSAAGKISHGRDRIAQNR